MASYRRQLPQLSGGLFFTDAGLETDLIFNHGIDIREFAAHTLLESEAGREALANYFRPFLSLAGELGSGFLLNTQTWKTHRHWAEDLQASPQELAQSNRDCVEFVAALRDEFSDNDGAIVIEAVIGPQGDAYAPESAVAIDAAEAYHSEQIGWLKDTDADMVSALTFAQAEDAAGLVRAAATNDMPAAVSFTVETDGRLPTGQPLQEAIELVDHATGGAPAYFMVNCAHPDHFFDKFNPPDWARRIRGLRCNASRLSHEELDNCDTLDDGDPVELAGQYRELYGNMPWLNIFGGCCGTDFRHVKAIAESVVS